MAKSPLTRTTAATVPAVAAGSTADQTVAEAPFAATVTGASFTPEAAMTGNDTNTRTLTVVNKGQAGAGTTVIGTIAFVAGNNGVAFDEKEFVLSGVAGATTVAAGDIIAYVSTHAASGLADPGGLVQVEFSRS